VDRSIEVSLQGKVQGIGAIVVFDGELLNLLLITVEDVFPKLTFGEGQGNMFDLSVHSPIGLVVLDGEALLPEDDVSIVGVVILLGGIKVTEHEGEGYVFLRDHLGRGV
jgi:hypothetical protein